MMKWELLFALLGIGSVVIAVAVVLVILIYHHVFKDL